MGVAGRPADANLHMIAHLLANTGYAAVRQPHAITVMNRGAHDSARRPSEMQMGGPGEPMLQKALLACGRHKARLLIPQLDRLSRNIAFIANIMDACAG